MQQELFESKYSDNGRPDTRITHIKPYAHIEPHIYKDLIDLGTEEFGSADGISADTARRLFRARLDIAITEHPRAAILAKLSKAFGIEDDIEMIERQKAIAECIYLEEFGLKPQESVIEFRKIKSALDALVTAYKQKYPQNPHLTNYNFSGFIQDCRIAVIRSKIAHVRHGLVATTSEERKANRTRRDLLKEVEESVVRGFTFANTSHDDRERQLSHFMMFGTSYNLDRLSQFSPELQGKIDEARSGVLEAPIRTSSVVVPLKSRGQA